MSLFVIFSRVRIGVRVLRRQIVELAIGGLVLALCWIGLVRYLTILRLLVIGLLLATVHVLHLFPY